MATAILPGERFRGTMTSGLFEGCLNSLRIVRLGVRMFMNFNKTTEISHPLDKLYAYISLIVKETVCEKDPNMSLGVSHAFHAISICWY